MHRFRTENSEYIIDDDEGQYMRLPASNRCRTLAEIERQKESWRLEDGKWLPLREWHTERDFTYGCTRLRIYTPDATFGVLTSPILDESHD